LRNLGAFYKIYLNINKGKSWAYPAGSNADKSWYPLVLMAMGGDRELVASNKYNGEDELNTYIHCPETIGFDKSSTKNPPDEGNTGYFLGTHISDWDFSKTSSYGFNGWLFKTTTAEKPFTWGCASSAFASGDPAKFPQFFASAGAARGSSDVPVFGEGTWWASWPEAADPAPFNLRDGAAEGQIAPQVNFMGRFAIDRHNRRINVVFLDGHVNTVMLSDLWSLKWHEGYVQPTPNPPPPPSSARGGGADYRW
jgi:prepilin-type processing-associated H-X9-DG protein